jgi:hypothetical protein
MSFTIPHLQQPSVKPLLDEEEVLSARGENQGPLAASGGSPTLEAICVYQQVRKELHGDDKRF